jgi:hypothetical protein
MKSVSVFRLPAARCFGKRREKVRCGATDPFSLTDSPKHRPSETPLHPVRPPALSTAITPKAHYQQYETNESKANYQQYETHESKANS